MPILKRIFAGAVLFFFAAATTQGAQGARCDNWAARLVSTQGVVEVQHPGSSEWRPTELEQTFCLGDRVRVQADSRAALELANDTILRLDEKTTLLLPQAATEEDFWIDLVEGALHLLSRVRRSLEVRTPFVNAGLEGTEFVVRILKDQTIVSVLEGRVAVSNALGRLSLVPGQTASATKNTPPVLRLQIRPEDTVQWALYYPLILDPAQPGADRATHEVQRALVLGRADQAGAQLDAILATDPSNPRALALASIVALARNATEQAVDFAERAVALAAGESSAHLALSYARQARFDLAGAKTAADAALAIDPNDAIAWARSAELWASLGDTDAALNAARQAVELAPELSRTQSVMGFVALTRLDLDQATTALETAIALDPTDPLPRVGQALVKIRRGALADGRRDLEIAVSLDPANALVRSYLGKAYFEEKRDREAGVEFERAKALDPLDPTPWVYDGIRKQTVNRSVEALGDLDRAKELNDYRGVYRSRLLLDQDEAARGVNLGGVYSDLGFDQLAAAQAWQSTSQDPKNFAAHELLAEAYAARSRHEVAQVSELLQANLLQPLGVFPVRSLAFASQPLLPGETGPDRLSFGEYTAMFDRNGLGGQVNASGGSNQTWGDRIAAFGLTDRFSFLGTQFHYETDGFRPNNDLSIDVYNVKGQVLLSHRSIAQVEIQREKRENGDLDLLFDLENFSPGNREKRDESFIRFGHRLDLTPQTTLLTSVIYSNTDYRRETNEVNQTPFGPVTRTGSQVEDVDAAIAEFQILSKQGMQHWVAGIGYYNEDTDGKNTTAFSAPPSFPFPFLLPDPGQSDADIEGEHSNGYVYSYRTIGEVESILGLSFDSFDFESNGDRIDTDQLNPKFGLIWRPDPTLTLRIAGFRTLKRSLIGNRTIEPTHVAGFNQFFDDVTGTDAKRLGLGLDYHLSSGHVVGAEVSGRDLDVPFLGGSSEEQKERALRGYYYRTFGDRWSASVAAELDKFERSPPLPQERKPNELRTFRLPIGVRYEHPNGLFGNLAAINVRQKIDGLAANGEDDEHFWTVNGSIGYRLPKRRGVIQLEIRNLFDQDFKYFGEDFQTGNLRRQEFLPERTVAVRASLNF